MKIDVPTLYVLLVGTTATAAALTYWERRWNSAHRREMGFWAFGYFLISAGCLLRIMGPVDLPVLTIGLSNIGVCLGYASILAGTLLFLNRPLGRSWIGLLGAICLAWLLVGMHLDMPARIGLTSTAVAVACIAGAIALGRGVAHSRLPSQKLATILFTLHGGFYAVRAVAAFLDPANHLAFTGVGNTFTLFEGTLWSASAPMILLVLVREKTERQLLETSNTDYLTGLDNRRALVRKAERVFAMSRDMGLPSALIVLDLDRFKSINDRFGHQLGDDVLKLFSRVAEAEMRPHDVVARLGGEEFAILMPGTSLPRAAETARRIAAGFTAASAEYDGLREPCTVSAGLAVARPGEARLDDMLAIADRGLYRAKASGRNRIEAEDDGRLAA